MSNEFPLYPELPEGAAIEAVKLLEKFKAEMRKIANTVFDDLYTDVLPYIESDAWTNFKNVLMDGLRNYNNRKVCGDYDFAQIRKAIYNEFRDDIIADLNQDMVKEIEDLKTEIKYMRERSRI